MKPEGTGRFTISLPSREADRLRRWGRWAITRGVEVEFIRALNEVNYRLSVEADEWGESRDEEGDPPLLWRFGSCSVLRVWYAVHLASRTVFVREFRIDPDYLGEIPPEFE